MTRTIDFDAFRAEQKSEPLHIRVGGEDYVLPADLPAEVALEVVALRATGSDGLPPDKIEPLARGMFGDEMYAALVGKHRLSLVELAALVVAVFAEYNKAMVPNRTARRRKKASSSA